jgi:signal peptidase II
MDEKTSRTALVWIWISILVVLLDQYSKYWITSHLQLHEGWDLVPSLRLFLGHNTGAAFSMLEGQPILAMYLFSSFAALVVLGLLFWLFCLSASSRWVSVSITLILGGAIGNLIDRVRFGYVVDFIDIYVNQWHWPIFNIADAAICIGAAMLAIDAIWLSAKREKS